MKKSLVFLILINISISSTSFAEGERGGGGGQIFSTTKTTDIHSYLVSAARNIDTSLATMADAAQSSSDPAVVRFFTEVVPRIKNSELLILTWPAGSVINRDGTIRNAVVPSFRDVLEREFAVFAYPTKLNKPREIKLYINERKLSEVYWTDVEAQTLGLIAFGIAITQEFDLKSATKVQMFVVKYVRANSLSITLEN